MEEKIEKRIENTLNKHIEKVDNKYNELADKIDNNNKYIKGISTVFIIGIITLITTIILT